MPVRKRACGIVQRISVTYRLLRLLAVRITGQPLGRHIGAYFGPT